ncbi:unnamed protein product [Tuber aestivum]|uniref:Uncharacterized protein n=1 Tax=Tuber aestivum TaxID=59557 RepID=A0A292PPT5_9PEZI|nr:unnamed protein product [Tuber aestivum]
MGRTKRNIADSRRKERSQRNLVNSIEKRDEEIYECIIVRLPDEIGACGGTREGVNTPVTNGGVVQAVHSAEHLTCPNGTLSIRASEARNTRLRARAKVFAPEPEQGALTPIRGVRARGSVCGNRIHKAPQAEMSRISISPQRAVTRKREARAADTPAKNPPARRGAQNSSNHHSTSTVETPKSILRRSTRKIPVSYFPPAETRRSLAGPAKRAKARVIQESGAIIFRPEIDADIPTEFEESNVRADLTGRPAVPVGRGGG